jgi:hypothetical protein
MEHVSIYSLAAKNPWAQGALCSFWRGGAESPAAKASTTLALKVSCVCLCVPVHSVL